MTKFSLYSTLDYGRKLTTPKATRIALFLSALLSLYIGSFFFVTVTVGGTWKLNSNPGNTTTSDSFRYHVFIAHSKFCNKVGKGAFYPIIWPLEQARIIYFVDDVQGLPNGGRRLIEAVFN